MQSRGSHSVASDTITVQSRRLGNLRRVTMRHANSRTGSAGQRSASARSAATQAQEKRGFRGELRPRPTPVGSPARRKGSRSRQVLHEKRRRGRRHRPLRRRHYGQTGLRDSISILGRSLRKERQEKIRGKSLPALPGSLSPRRRRRQDPQENRKAKQRNRQGKNQTVAATFRWPQPLFSLSS